MSARFCSHSVHDGPDARGGNSRMRRHISRVVREVRPEVGHAFRNESASQHPPQHPTRRAVRLAPMAARVEPVQRAVPLPLVRVEPRARGSRVKGPRDEAGLEVDVTALAETRAVAPVRAVDHARVERGNPFVVHAALVDLVVVHATLVDLVPVQVVDHARVDRLGLELVAPDVVSPTPEIDARDAQQLARQDVSHQEAHLELEPIA
jgi:hypothetical protein